MLNMNSFNVVGRLTDKPQLMTTGNTNIAKFNIAINRPGKDAGADFPRFTAFGKAAEFLSQYGEKGMEAAITGRIQTGSYQGKDGKTVYTTDLVVDKCTLGAKSAGGQTAPAAQPTAAAQPQQAYTAPGAGVASDGDIDDIL